jgi:hypothetical protein
MVDATSRPSPLELYYHYYRWIDGFARFPTRIYYRIIKYGTCNDGWFDHLILSALVNECVVGMKVGDDLD